MKVKMLKRVVQDFKVYEEGEVYQFGDNPTFSPRAYRVVSMSKPETTRKRKRKPAKRKPRARAKARNSAITNKDKE